MATISKTKQRETRIRTALNRYPVIFDCEDAAIDLRTMAQNYSNGIIPSADIGLLIDAVLGPSPFARKSVDPERDLPVPQFVWADIDDVAIDPRFQRDVSPNHVAKIESDFEPDFIIVPCAIKDPVSGKYLLWDGHHTTRVCERMGWSKIPVWYTHAEIDDTHSVEEAERALILKAGRSFISINSKNKRAVSRYDEHMISVECGFPEPVIIQNIVNANNCRVRRVSAKAGDISHVENLYAAYELVQTSSGIKGIYLARALKFHTETWPKEEIRGTMLIALARLYHQTETQTGKLLPPEFDKEFGDLLKSRKLYGMSEKVHLSLREQYLEEFGTMGGIPVVVTSGLILTYNKHGSRKFKLAQPEVTFKVK